MTWVSFGGNYFGWERCGSESGGLPFPGVMWFLSLLVTVVPVVRALWVARDNCCSVTSNSLRSHRLQHARLPCPSLSPRICSNSCPSTKWCRPMMSSPVAPFSSSPQSFSASGSFPMSQLFSSGGQSIEASASVLPMNIQGISLIKMDIYWFTWIQKCKPCCWVFLSYSRPGSSLCLCLLFSWWVGREGTSVSSPKFL